MTLFILPSSTTAQNPCRIAYDNLLERGTVTASSENAAYPVANAYDWLTCDFFKPAAAGTVYINLTLTMPGSANYLAVYNQDVYKYGGTIGLQYYNGTTWVDATSGVAPANNAPRIVFFDTKTATQWRLVIICTQVFSLGVVSFGQYLALPYGMYLGWAPPRFARATRLTTSLSDGGAFLGRSVLANGIRTTLVVQFVPTAWMEANWLPLVRHIERKPFFFAPQVVKRPLDVALVWSEDEVPAPTFTHYNGYMGATLNIRGVVE
ncbi:hypothetical protein [Methylobacterium sp. Gmos1]